MFSVFGVWVGSEWQVFHKSTSRICIALATGVEERVKEMSLLKYQGREDRTSLQQTAREAMISNKLSDVHNQLLVMEQNGCAPYDKPLSPESYSNAIGRCSDAKDRAGFMTNADGSTGHQITAESKRLCDPANWHPDP